MTATRDTHLLAAPHLLLGTVRLNNSDFDFGRRIAYKENLLQTTFQITLVRFISHVGKDVKEITQVLLKHERFVKRPIGNGVQPPTLSGSIFTRRPVFNDNDQPLH